MKLSLCFAFLFTVAGSLSAQSPPINDNCSGAIEIFIPQNGYGYDTLAAPKSDVSFATREIGEMCSKELEDIGNCDKTVWYKFYLPTARNVGVKLTQADSAIPQIFSGFNIYQIKSCGYVVSDLSTQL